MRYPILRCHKLVFLHDPQSLSEVDNKENNKSEENKDILLPRPMGLSAEVKFSRILRGTFAKFSRKIIFIFDVFFLKFLL